MKNTKPKVFFKPIEGSGPLSIDWHQGGKGDAVEAINELGVGFFSPSGELLGVIFDDVDEQNDQQVLKFKNSLVVELKIKNSKIDFKLKTKKSFLEK